MNTPERKNGQGNLIKKGLRVVASFGIGVSSLLSPLDSPKEVNAESNLQQQNALTLLHGDGSRARLNIMLLPYNSTTQQMLQEVAEDIFLIPPTNEFKDKVNVYTINPVGDLKCDQVHDCDWNAVTNEIERIAATGFISHETLVVVKSNDENYGNGGATREFRQQPPTLTTSSMIVRPATAWRAPEVRELFASSIAHELWGHAFAGFDHEGGDLMVAGGGTRFNSQHTQFLRSHFALAPYNYLTPKSEVKVTGGSLSLKAELITPTGTTQKKRWIIPANNDGPDITLLRNPEGFFEVPAPQIGVGNYILLPDMTYTWKEWSSNKPTALPWASPEWDRFEGWPGIFFPNTPAEVRIKTPKRFSSGIGLITLAGGQQTNDLTPTLQWNNRDQDVFYYEVQVSKDSTFNTDPQTATAALYWELRHGGMTNPLNSYTVPNNYPLEKSSTYYWRVRPRIQGDGTPVAWSNIGSFKTSADARVQTYSQELVDKDYGNGVIGPSQADYDKANPQPEPISTSPLATWRRAETFDGDMWIFDPGTTPPQVDVLEQAEKVAAKAWEAQKPQEELAIVTP